MPVYERGRYNKADLEAQKKEIEEKAKEQMTQKTQQELTTMIDAMRENLLIAQRMNAITANELVEHEAQLKKIEVQTRCRSFKNEAIGIDSSESGKRMSMDEWKVAIAEKRRQMETEQRDASVEEKAVVGRNEYDEMERNR